MKERLLKVEEVAVALGCSVKTINTWYTWRQEEPKHELAKMLPDYVQEAPRQTRYWKESDIEALLAFQKALPKGRNGILGAVTQKYIKKEKTDEKGSRTE